jgi:galactokinase
MGKGLSSSAAVCVLVVRCFSALYGLDLSLAAVMELAYCGERRSPSRCGRMDQCVAMGGGRAGVMEFDRQDCHLRLLPCKRPMHFVVADLNRSKNTTKILQALQACFPYPRDETQAGMHRYVSESQALALAACAAIEAGDAAALGGAMREAQRLFDDTAAKVKRLPCLRLLVLAIPATVLQYCCTA